MMAGRDVVDVDDEADVVDIIRQEALQALDVLRREGVASGQQLIAELAQLRGLRQRGIILQVSIVRGLRVLERRVRITHKKAQGGEQQYSGYEVVSHKWFIGRGSKMQARSARQVTQAHCFPQPPHYCSSRSCTPPVTDRRSPQP